MSTQMHTVGAEWTQITDGTKTFTLQVLGDGWVFLFVSDTKPDHEATGHLVDRFMTITPPTIAWVRAVGGTGEITVDIAVS